MSTSFACNGFNSVRITRRNALQIGGAGLLGLNLPRLFAAEEKRAANAPPVRAKSVIFLFQFGGPSHIDMFDMKPNAPDGIRGPYKPIPSAAPEIQVCEKLPEVAKVMDKVTLIRSMTHNMKNHNSASYYALTGHAPPLDDIRLRDSIDLFPAYGSVVSKLLPAQDPSLPTFVAYPHVCRDGSITPGQHASFLGKEHDPLLITEDPSAADFKLPEFSLPAGVSMSRLENRRELQKLVDRQSRLLDFSAEAQGIDAYYERALAMLNSDKVRKAFDLSQEPDELRDKYGRHTYGQSCLLARRLVESGVRFVNVYFSDSIGGQSTERGGWDTHGFNNTRMFPIVEKRHFPITEETLPTFLRDMDDRGLLDTTLVVWMGEFGRTPKINDNISRDHWPQCYTTLLAGGGVKRGFVYGASDKDAVYPARDPVRPDDLAATMFFLMGIDPRTEVYDAQNRPHLIGGDVVHSVIA
jgi:hypothetical protein